mmetsp:Transcript_2646/g.4424  ORF Transcript_2646/g.4424 Transcript_2646/m.4424 type:complete len:138 (+) Transcript_2646:42-455(+)
MNIVSEIRMPADWYSVKINKRCTLYLNVKQKVASLSPVFPLHQSKMMLETILGQSISFGDLDKQIKKLEQDLMMQSNHFSAKNYQLIDENALQSVKKFELQLQQEHSKFEEEIRACLDQHNLKLGEDREGYDVVRGN